MDFVRRRRKLLTALAVGGIGAAAVYYWWSSGEEEQQGEDGPSRGRAQEPAGRQGEGSGAQGDGDAAEEQEQEETMDESMASHFSYIQQVSAPQELEQLLPRLQAVLAEATDIAAQLQQVPAGATAADKLKLMAKLSLARALGAVWLLPVADLYVRAKLNVIGRHLFLQEKLSKLRQPPASQSLGLLYGIGPDMGGPGACLPPRLAASAVEAFLGCGFFENAGARWLVAKVIEGVDTCLASGTPAVDAVLGPQELVQALGSMLVAVEQALGPAVDWPGVLVGSDSVLQAASLQQQQQQGSSGSRHGPSHASAAAMVEDLHAELRTALASPEFAAALREAVGACFRALAAHAYADAFPEPAGGSTAGGSTAGGSPGAGGASAGASPGGARAGPAQGQAAASGAGAGDAGAPGSSNSSGSSSAAAGSASNGAGSQPQAGGRGASRSGSTAALASSLVSTGMRVSGSLKSIFGYGVSSGGAGGSTGAAAAPGLGAGPSQGQGLGGEQAAAAGAGAAAAALPQKAPRPLARLLKPVQGTSDSLFAGAKNVTAAISQLPAVMALCSSVFASPGLHEDFLEVYSC